MNISPSEAEEALQAVQLVTQKTRHSIAGSSASVTLIATGVVWLIGFMCTQFLAAELLPYIWTGLSILGTALGFVLGRRLGKRVRSQSMLPTAKRIAFFWLFLIFFCIAVIAIAWPLDGKQVTVLIILFSMIGHLSLGLLLSYAYVWWVLPVAVLVVIIYFLLPGFFYFWMSLLGGGGMIILGLYIHYRW